MAMCSELLEGQLGTTLEMLLQENVQPDVDLECKGGVIRAHKCVLTASSPYFEAMFTADMAERNSGCVDLRWCTREAMEIIVQYFYTGTTPISINFPILNELVEICHFMQLESLLVICWGAMLNYLTVESFAPLWVLAVNLGLVDMNVALTKFAQANIDKIADADNIPTLDDVQMEMLILNVDPRGIAKYIFRCISNWKQGGQRDEKAAKLIQKIHLQQVPTESLCRMFQTVFIDDN